MNALVISILLFNTITAQSSSPWKLSWSDEFNGNTLNTSKWNVKSNFTHCYPPDPCEEHQLYIKDGINLKNGRLQITTQKQTVIGPNGIQKKFTSGWIDSKTKFAQKQGRWEANCSLPSRNASGIWPAFWLLPSTLCWPTGSEIDIFEYGGNTIEDDIFGSYHWGTKCGKDKFPIPGKGYQPVHSAIDWQRNFHVYAVEWTATKLDYYVDDVLYFSRATKDGYVMPTEEMYIILNQAVGGIISAPTGDYDGGVVLIVEYVRVYESVPSMLVT